MSRTSAPKVPQASRICMVMPAFNEEAALGAVLAEVPEGILHRLVVVNNNSTDATAQVAEQAGATVVFAAQRGYGSACLKGLEYLLDGAERGGLEPPLDGGDVIVFMDADHSDYPQDLPEVLAPILEGRAQMVIGSRILGGADMQALLPQAWFGNRLACFLLWILFGARHTDLGPFRAIRVDALRALEMADRDYGWTIEMQLKAKTQGLSVVEVPVRYRPRIGESKITGTFVGTVRAGWKIIGWILVWRLRLWFRPQESPRSR